MAWPEEITDGLPAPRNNEPTGLRQDIVDELSDHLYCAINRELHCGHDETKAKQNVLERFGNPARIAYRLWFDAMKEKIMSQRITLAAVLVLTAASLFMGVVTWQMAQQSRETNIALLEQNRDANSAILDKLSALATPQDAYKSLDWNPVKIKLVTGDENGPPAVGFKATLSGAPGSGKAAASNSTMPTLEDVSGNDGVIDFGLVRYGTYNLSIVSYWSESRHVSVTVRPGESFSATMVCPSEPHGANVSIEIDWPDDLKKEKLWAWGTISFQSPRFEEAGKRWDDSFFSLPTRSALFTDSGTTVDCGTLNVYRDSDKGLRSYQVPEMKPAPYIEVSGRPMKLVQVHILAHPQPELDGKIELPNRPLASFYYNPRESGGGGFGVEDIVAWRRTYRSRPFERVEIEAKPTDAPKFEPKPRDITRDINRWKITLPDELIAYVREQLATNKVR